MQNLSDRALKERIIGAAVLVVVAVLIVPVFLDGSADDAATVSQSITLPGQDDQGRSQQTIVLERDREEPVPQAPAQASPAPAPVRQESPRPEPAETEAASEAAAAAPAETAPAEPEERAAAASADESETGMWAVQLGSFSSQENAEKLAASLREQGFAAFLSQLQTDSGPLHRVRIGPQADRDSAESIAAQLGRAGHTGQVVPHP